MARYTEATVWETRPAPSSRQAVWLQAAKAPTPALIISGVISPAPASEPEAGTGLDLGMLCQGYNAQLNLTFGF